MTWLDRLGAAALLLLAMLCVAGIVHIGTILALPKIATPDAFTRLSALVKSGRMTILPRALPGTTLLPFADPAVARGLCMFDLSKAALRLRGTVDPDELVTFSFRTREGHVFYSMTDRAAQQGRVDVLLLSQAQLEAIEAAVNEDEETSQELRLVAPEVKGLIFVDALAAFPGDWANAVRRVEQITCEAEAIAEE
jgi:uncharacterized membrane protein